MLAKVTVADYMTTKLVTLAKDTHIFEAIKKLLDHHITSAPVIDKQGRLIGMFSEKDGMRVVLESVYNQSMSGKVGEFMNAEVLSIDASSSIVDLAEKFQSSAIRSFPVFEQGNLVGIVSRTDVLRALTNCKA
ncbi:MAG: CBS domain-containing protein [Methylococcaceae bacterium]|jgi:CBS domain-containing protein